MLILSRKPGQTIVIGEAGIVIRILQIKHSHCSVGIEAPPDIRIRRGELESFPERPTNEPEAVDQANGETANGSNAK